MASQKRHEGRCCELGQRGYSRDGRPDRPQIVFGLLCAADGCPVAVEVFAGDTGDPKTLATQIDKLKKRFGLKRVVLVGDRGMITGARIDEELKPAGLDWITALRAPATQALAVEGGPLQLSLFDDRDMAEISSPDFPGERLVVCRNPDLAAERARKRDDLLAATEGDLANIQAATTRLRHPFRGPRSRSRSAPCWGVAKVAKHFRLTISEETLGFVRNEAAIAAEAALDGFYVLRTSVPANNLDAGAFVLAYKSLAQVERAFRSLKSIDLDIRPVHHRLAGRVRAHVFLCMLAYYVQWHMRRKLAPLLFEDHDRPAAAAARTSPVASAQVSAAARAKARARKTEDGQPVHSFRTLIADLATLTRNTVRFGDNLPMTVLSRPTPLQQRAFDLLAVALTP